MFAFGAVRRRNYFIANLNRCRCEVKIVIRAVVAFPGNIIGLENPNGIVSQIVVGHYLFRCHHIVGRCILCQAPTRHFIIGTINQRYFNWIAIIDKSTRVGISKRTAIRIPFKIMLVHLPNCIVSQIGIRHCFDRLNGCCGISRRIPTFECVAFTVGCCCRRYLSVIIDLTAGALRGKLAAIGVPLNCMSVDFPDGVVVKLFVGHCLCHIAWCTIYRCCPTHKGVTCACRVGGFNNWRVVINRTACVVARKSVATIDIPRKLVRVYLPNGVEIYSTNRHSAILTVISYYVSVWFFRPTQPIVIFIIGCLRMAEWRSYYRIIIKIITREFLIGAVVKIKSGVVLFNVPQCVVCKVAVGHSRGRCYRFGSVFRSAPTIKIIAGTACFRSGDWRTIFYSVSTCIFTAEVAFVLVPSKRMCVAFIIDSDNRRFVFQNGLLGNSLWCETLVCASSCRRFQTENTCTLIDVCRFSRIRTVKILLIVMDSIMDCCVYTKYRIISDVASRNCLTCHI